MEFIKFNKSLFDLKVKSINKILQFTNKNIQLAFNMNGCFGSINELFYGVGNQKLTEFLYTNHFEVCCFKTDKECISYFETFKNEGIDINIHIIPEDVLIKKSIKRFSKTGKQKKDKIVEVLNPIIEDFFNMPKIDLNIMNPPYDNDLHINILKYVLKINSNKFVLNISPNWFYDYKKDFDLRPNNIVALTYEESIKLFNGIQLQYPLAITYFDKTSKNFADTKKFVNSAYNIFKNKTFDISLKDVNATNYNEKGYFVPLKLMTSCWDKNKNFILDKIGILYNGKTLTGEYYKNKRSRNKDRPCGGIYVKTKNEAINLANSFKTNFYIAWVNAFHTNSRYLLNEYPFMGDYSKPWDDKRFCEYFGITGYISDTEAEPGSEWETILNTMKEYK